MVKVKPTASQGRITVRSNNDTTIFGIKDNLSEYYAKLAEKWANSPDMVNGIDYSSKHYAEEARTSAETSANYVNEIQEVYDRIAEDVNEAQATINDLKNNSIDYMTNVSSLLTDQIGEKAEEISELMDENCKSLPMFTPVWADHLYNDASYLRADTFSWHKADIYVTGYSIIEREYNDENCIIETENGIIYKRTPNGFKIANVDQQEAISNLYESNGKAWFYIIDIENRAFKLPREKNTTGKYLYFFIGNYTRPDSEVNIGILTELASGKDLDSILEEIQTEIETTTTAEINAVKKEVNNAKTEALNAITNVGINTRANTSLSNLTSTGEKHFINKSQITNCILEKPKYLNWEYSNGSFTLKAGSKLLRPAGLNADGSRKFDYITTQKDVTWGNTSVTDKRAFWLVSASSANPSVGNYSASWLQIGDTAITPTISYGMWYDTKTNWIKVWDSTNKTWGNAGVHFPFAFVKGNGTNFDYPQAVFDGIGVFDKTFWMADGIKVLIPNGRNTDGTLKNKEVTSKACIYNAGWNVAINNAPICITSNGTMATCGTQYAESEIQPTTNYTCWYNPTTNLIKYKGTGTDTFNTLSYAVIGSYSGVYGSIWDGRYSNTDINSKEAFRAIGYDDFNGLLDSDKSTIAKFGLPTSSKTQSFTAGASGATYKMPADGWLYAYAVGSQTDIGKYMRITNSTLGFTVSAGANFDIPRASIIPVRAGDTVTISYTQMTLSTVKLYYLQGGI